MIVLVPSRQPGAMGGVFYMVLDCCRHRLQRATKLRISDPKILRSWKTGARRPITNFSYIVTASRPAAELTGNSARSPGMITVPPVRLEPEQVRRSSSSGGRSTYLFKICINVRRRSRSSSTTPSSRRFWWRSCTLGGLRRAPAIHERQAGACTRRWTGLRYYLPSVGCWTKWAQAISPRRREG